MQGGPVVRPRDSPHIRAERVAELMNVEDGDLPLDTGCSELLRQRAPSSAKSIHRFLDVFLERARRAESGSITGPYKHK